MIIFDEAVLSVKQLQAAVAKIIIIHFIYEALFKLLSRFAETNNNIRFRNTIHRFSKNKISTQIGCQIIPVQ